MITVSRQVYLKPNETFEMKPEKKTTTFNIQNVYWSDSCELIVSNGSNINKIGDSSQEGARLNQNMKSTFEQFYALKNTSDKIQSVGFDGVLINN